MTAKTKREITSLCEDLTRHLIETGCTNLETLTLVDKICRRTFTDIECAWVRWHYYMEICIFKGDEAAYNAWAKTNANHLY